MTPEGKLRMRYVQPAMRAGKVIALVVDVLIDDPEADLAPKHYIPIRDVPKSDQQSSRTDASSDCKC